MDRPAAPNEALAPLLPRWREGAPGPRAAFRRRLLDVNPFYWLAARDRLKPLLVWLLLGALGAAWVLGNWKWARLARRRHEPHAFDLRPRRAEMLDRLRGRVSAGGGSAQRRARFATVHAADDREILAANGGPRAPVRRPVAIVLLADGFLCGVELRAAGSSEREFIMLVFASRG